MDDAFGIEKSPRSVSKYNLLYHGLSGEVKRKSDGGFIEWGTVLLMGLFVALARLVDNGLNKKVEVFKHILPGGWVFQHVFKEQGEVFRCFFG